MTEKDFAPGDVIKLYGVYRCSCGEHAFFGVSGRRFPRAHCPAGSWQMVMRAREETFF
jgi:hypothetical protein